MTTINPNKPKFKLIQGLTNQEDVVVGLARKKNKIALLCRSLELQLASTFTGQVDVEGRTFEIAYPVNQDLFALKEKLNQIKGQEQILATIMIPGEILGINFHIKELSPTGIVCHFPEHIYQINRRASKRWKTPPQKSNLYVEFNLPLISPLPIILPLNDLSIHGLSFKVPVFLKNFFKQGQMFPNVNLRMGVKNINLVLEIRNQFVNNEDKYPLKVGVKFHKTTPEIQMDIQKFIKQNEESKAV